MTFGAGIRTFNFRVPRPFQERHLEVIWFNVTAEKWEVAGMDGKRFVV